MPCILCIVIVAVRLVSILSVRPEEESASRTHELVGHIAVGSPDEDLQAELGTDARILVSKIVWYYVPWVFGITLICICVGGLLGLLSGLKVEVTDDSTGKGLLVLGALLSLAAVGMMAWLMMKEGGRTVDLLDGGFAQEVFVQLGESFIQQASNLRVGQTLHWSLVLGNPTKTELQLQAFEGNVYLQDVHIAEIELAQPVSIDSLSKQDVLVDAYILSVGTLLGVGAKSAAVLLDDVLGSLIYVHLEIMIRGALKSGIETSWGDEFEVQLVGDVPFDLQELPPINTWPDSLGQPGMDVKVKQAITKGLQKKHDTADPDVVIDWKESSLRGSMVTKLRTTLWLLAIVLVFISALVAAFSTTQSDED